MALAGRAFLAMWHDIAEAGDAEYNAWHTRQHMPERLGVPGFRVGRRYGGGRRPARARRPIEPAQAMVREGVEVAAAQSAVYDLAYLLRAEDLA